MKSLLESVEINGELLRLAKVQFREPAHFRHLLQSTGFYDAEGERYSLHGLGMKIKAVLAAKRGKAETVLCRKSECGWEVVRFGHDWIF